jgi:hypothetical protein
MGKYKVAILDSGVDKDCDELKMTETDGINLVSSPLDDNYYDDNGHGTACATIIKRVNQNVKMHIVKILDNNCLTSSLKLIESLKYVCAREDIRLINLSIATVNEKYRNELKEICNLIIENGKIIVSSTDNINMFSYPAIFDNVIGVCGSYKCKYDEYWYNKNYQVQCVTNNIPIFLPSINKKYKLFGGTSKGAAILTGIISEILEQIPDIGLNELNEILEKRSKKNQWNQEEIYSKRNIKKFPPEIDKYCKKKLDFLVDIISLCLNIKQNKEVLYISKLSNPSILLNTDNIYDIVCSIEKALDFKLDYSKITAETVESVYSIYEFIYGI